VAKVTSAKSFKERRIRRLARSRGLYLVKRAGWYSIWTEPGQQGIQWRTSQSLDVIEEYLLRDLPDEV